MTNLELRIERSRHEQFFGREEVLAAIDRLLTVGPSGWVVVTGSPGIGKSALLCRWTDREEQAGRSIAHAFLGSASLAARQPEVVIESLCAQLEQIYRQVPSQHDEPLTRLMELLRRISHQVLQPRGERLVLVIDGLDELEAGGQPDFGLPSHLPRGVFALCASRPTASSSWLGKRDGVQWIRLDEEAWVRSSTRACKEFWTYHAPLFQPPLPPALVERAVRNAEGNLLYCVKLREWLEGTPPERRQADVLPRGLGEVLERIWEQLGNLPDRRRESAVGGLGLLCAAREPLTREMLETATRWNDPFVWDHFKRDTRAFVLERSTDSGSVRVYRPYYEPGREFIADKIGITQMRDHHRRILDTLARWPPEEESHRGYAARHAMAHALAAGDVEAALRLCWDIDYIEGRLREERSTAGLRRDVGSVCASISDEIRRNGLITLRRALRGAARHLVQAPEDAASTIYSRLVSLGWRPEQVESTLRLPRGLPPLRLLHPVRPAHLQERIFDTSSMPAICCALAPDGVTLITTHGSTLRFWNHGTLEPIRTVETGAGEPTACAVTPDGRRLVCILDETKVGIWSLDTGERDKLEEPISAQSIRITPDGWYLAVTTTDGSIVIRGVDSEEPIFKPRRTALTDLTACASNHESSLLALGGSDGQLVIYDLKSGESFPLATGHAGAITDCVIHAEARLVISASDDGTLRVSSISCSEPVVTLAGHDGAVNACALLHDPLRVVSASNDGTLRLWHLQAGHVPVKLARHHGAVNDLAVSADGHVVSASDDGSVIAWNLDALEYPPPRGGHTTGLLTCAVTPDGRRVATGSADGFVELWDTTTGEVLATFIEADTTITTCAIVPDGSVLAAADSDGFLRVLRKDGSALKDEIIGREENGSEWCMSTNGRWAASVSSDLTARLWSLHDKYNAAPDIEAGAVSRIWGLASRSICALSADGRHLLHVSPGNILEVWSLHHHQAVRSWSVGTTIRACAISADGETAATADASGCITVYRVGDGAIVGRIRAEVRFNCLALCSELLTAGDDEGNLWLLRYDSPKHAGSSPAGPIRLFVVNEASDNDHVTSLDKHLALLKRECGLETWSRCLLRPGEEIESEATRRFDEANIFVVLVSADLVSSRVYDQFVLPALDRQRRGRAEVIAVIVRAVDLEGSPLAALTLAPRGGLPIESWPKPDEAWKTVTETIRLAIEQWPSGR